MQEGKGKKIRCEHNPDVLPKLNATEDVIEGNEATKHYLMYHITTKCVESKVNVNAPSSLDISIAFHKFYDLACFEKN